MVVKVKEVILLPVEDLDDLAELHWRRDLIPHHPSGSIKSLCETYQRQQRQKTIPHKA